MFRATEITSTHIVSGGALVSCSELGRIYAGGSSFLV